MLSMQCTLEDHTKEPSKKSCLGLAQTLHKKASAAQEAAMQLQVHPKELLRGRKALLNMVRTQYCCTNLVGPLSIYYTVMAPQLHAGDSVKCIWKNQC